MVFSQKQSYFYVPVKTIHGKAKYTVIDYHDQEAKKSRHLVNLTEGYW